MHKARVVVVGAGIGGLVSALLLASRGLQVQVLESASVPGGKMRQLTVAGQPIDAGPTVMTMRWVFEQIFRQAGSQLQDHVTLTPLQVLGRHAWGPHAARDRLDLYADRARSVDAIGRFAGAAEARRFEAFCVEVQRLYRTLEGPYIRSPRPSVAGIVSDLGLRGLAQLVALRPLTSMWSLLCRRFDDPRLRQMFGRYATYCGTSPWAAPATLALVAQVEMDGVWSVDGGMHGLARAVARLAAQHGAEFSYDSVVSEISVRGDRGSQRVDGVRTADGHYWPADAVIFNGDADALAQGFLGKAVQCAVPPRLPSDRSLSALTASVVARTGGFPLTRHNVFFHDDYAAEFKDIERGGLPTRGTVYLCAQDRDDSGTDPGRPERMLMLVNAPPHGDRVAADPLELQTCEQTSLALLKRCGLQISPTPDASAPSWVRTTPQDFNRLYPGSGGGLYGTATRGWMALFRRPGSTTRLPGLYLTGGSVHPGPGVPMAAMSGVLAAETLLAHHASTKQFPGAATCGGTSTPSATMAGTALPSSPSSAASSRPTTPGPAPPPPDQAAAPTPKITAV